MMKFWHEVEQAFFQNEVLDGYLYQTVSIQQLARTFRKIIKPYGAKLQVKRDRKDNAIFISGLFDESKKPNITLTLSINKDSHYTYMTEVKDNSLRFNMAQTLIHELIHRVHSENFDRVDRCIPIRYSKSLPKNRVNEMKYLSDFEEIDAYTHDIALEILHYYPNQDPLKILSTIHKRKKVPSYKMYRLAFKGIEEWDNINKLLLKKTYRWLTNDVDFSFN
jgi:hypothetical protein